MTSKIRRVFGLIFVVALLFVFGQSRLNANGEQVDVSITATIDGDNNKVDLFVGKANYGANIVPSFNNVDEGSVFAFWIINGVIDINEPEETTFKATNDFNAVAVFYKESQSVAVYVDHSGILLDSFYDVATPNPDEPNKIGYDFNEWQEISKPQDFVKVYKATYTLNHDDVKVNGDDTRYNSVVSLEGDESKAWVKDGVVVSYNQNYTFSALKDTVVAQRDLEIDEVAKNLVTLELLEGYRTGYTTYLAQVELFEGDLVEYGLEVNGELKKASTIHTLTNEFLISTTNLYSAVRAYAVVEANETFIYVYSDFIYKEQGLMIYEVYTGGGNTSAIYKHDYVVLYNASDVEIDLSDYSLQYASTSGSFTVKNALTGTVAANDFYSIRLASGGNVGLELQIDFDQIVLDNPINLAIANGKLALVAPSEGNIIGIFDPNVVDFVGYGTANQFENSVAPALTSTVSLRRNSLIDTDDNGKDFVAGSIDLSYLPELQAVTISFNSNGGSSVDDIVIIKGSKVVSLPTPSKDQYLFGGWFIDIGLNTAFDLDDTVEEDITLYAKWDEPSSDLMFFADFNGLPDIPYAETRFVFTNNVGENMAWVLKEVWHKQSDDDKDMLRLRGANLAYIYTEKAIEEVTSISFDAKPFSSANDAAVIKVYYLEIGEMEWIQVGDSITFEDLEFKNVSIDIEKENIRLKIEVTGKSANIDNLKIFGVNENEATDPTYTVTFNSNGGTPVPSQQTLKIFDKITKPADPEKTDNTFLGWFEKADFSENAWNFDIDLMPNYNMTLHAKFEAGQVESEIYSTGWEDADVPSQPSYTPIIREKTTEGIVWQLFQGEVVTTGSPLTPPKNAQFRVSAANAGPAYLNMKNDFTDKSITRISFNASMASQTGVDKYLKIYYKLSTGDWVLFDTVTPGASKTAFEIVFEDSSNQPIEGIVNIKLEMSYSGAVTANRDTKIDDIVIYGYNE